MVLCHKVRVFVFRFDGDGPQFLLLRRRPRTENALGPVKGRVAVDERLCDAVLREVRDETGLTHPTHLIDLDHTSTLQLGDEGLVEWEFGYQAPYVGDTCRIRPGPEVVESIWAPFEHAFQTIELPEDRETLVRLQIVLQAG